MSDYALAACPVCGLVFFKHPGREYPPCHSVSESENILDLNPTQEVSDEPIPIPAPDLGPHLEAPLQPVASDSTETGPGTDHIQHTGGVPAPRRRRSRTNPQLISGGTDPTHHPSTTGEQP